MTDLESRDHIEAVRLLQEAETAYRSSDPRAALGPLSSCVRLDPGLFRGWELLGMMRLLQADLGGAKECMYKVGTADRNFTEAGTVLAAMGSPGWPAGDSAVDRVASLAALGQIFLTKGSYEASAVCFRALEAFTEPGWQVRSLLGFIYRQMDLLEVSLHYYDLALGCGGPADEVGFDRALVLAKLGRLEEAARDLKNFSEGPKGSPQSWNDLGAVLEALERLDGAMEAYEKAIALSPGYYPALYSKGKLLQKLGRMEEARPYLEKALDIEGRVFDLSDVQAPKMGKGEGRVRVKEIMK